MKNDPLTPYYNKLWFTQQTIGTTFDAFSASFLERRTNFGVKPNTVRLSAGIENKQDLLDDLKLTLECI